MSEEKVEKSLPVFEMPAFFARWRVMKMLKKVVTALLTSLAFGGMAKAELDLDTLKNPILQYDDWSIKDYGIEKKGDTYYVFFFRILS